MNLCIKSECTDEFKPNPKIPRPLNAFMLYANENRRRMSQTYPTESNKEISKRLGNGWKTLNDEDRKRFFEKAKAIGVQHKKEYPDYVYNPKEARIRKAMRDATRDRSIGASPMLPRPNFRRASHNNWLPPHEDLMMPNPLAQLQQHTEMWHDYQTMRPRSSGNSYMMPEYHSDTNQMNRMMIEKQSTTQQNIEDDTSLQTTASLSNCNMAEKNHEVGDFVDGKTGLEGTQNSNSQDHFIRVFEQNANEVETRFDPIDDHNNKAKKDEIESILNEEKLLNDPNYQNNYILEYFEKLPSMCLMNITTTDGSCFPFAKSMSKNSNEIIKNEMRVFENIAEPNFFYTDVGCIPFAWLSMKY